MEVEAQHLTRHQILNYSPSRPSSASSSSCSCVFCVSCFSCGKAQALPWHSCHLSHVPPPHLHRESNISNYTSLGNLPLFMFLVFFKARAPNRKGDGHTLSVNSLNNYLRNSNTFVTKHHKLCATNWTLCARSWHLEYPVQCQIQHWVKTVQEKTRTI